MHRRLPPLIAALTIAALVGCGSSAADSAAGQVSSAASAPAAPSSPDCHSQAVAWRNAGGQAQVNAITADLNSIQSAARSLAAAINNGTDESAAESALQTAAASLGSDSQAGEANLPPACIPGFRGDYGQALTDFSKAAADWQDGITELVGRDGNVATRDISAGTAADNAGNAKLSAAAEDLEAFDGS